MARGIPKRVRRVAVVAAGIAGVAAFVTRKMDVKPVLMDRLAVPSGPLGWLAATTMPMAHRAFYGPAADLLQPEPSDVLLDVACGSGVFLDEFAPDAARVTGIDLSDIQIRLARKRLAGRIEAGTAEVVVGDALHLPWDHESFSAVTCLGSLEYISDPKAALREMRRVLRPGGRLVVSYGVDRSSEDLARMMENWGIPNPPEEEARKIVEEAGFSLVSVTHLEGDFPARFLTGIKPAHG